MSTTLQFPDVGPDASSGDDRRPGSIDIGWAEQAFASQGKTESGHLRSSRQHTPTPRRRRVALVLCALVLIFAGVVISAATLSPATAPASSHHAVTTTRPATSATTPTPVHLGPLPLLGHSGTSSFLLNPLDSPLLVAPDRPGPNTSR
jgi:hypothetical protein